MNQTGSVLLTPTFDSCCDNVTCCVPCLSCCSLQLFALLGFVVSAVLISAVASEVVSLLHMLGVVLKLSTTVLGLTLLAWGNSIGGDNSYYYFYFSPKTILLYVWTWSNIYVCIYASLFFRLFFRHHYCPTRLSTDGHICLLWRHHFQYPYLLIIVCLLE